MPKSPMMKRAPQVSLSQNQEKLTLLPTYEGPYAVRVNSIDSQPVFWSDAAGRKWWLAMRPDGTYCKMPKRD